MDCNFVLIFASGLSLLSAKQPNFVLIVADDYGWNDIGYHGSSEVKTPNLDQLAADGIKLENYYVQPICTPTRSQLLSGKYQIHTGLQHFVIEPCSPNGLPLEHSTIADQLKGLGYSTHIVGKWHLGFYKKEYMPLYRGFDTHLGYLLGEEDYFNHTRCWQSTTYVCGIDFRENGRATDSYRGQYSTHIFTERVKELIAGHNDEKPMFIYLPFQAVHAPEQVIESYVEPFKRINDMKRRIYLAMVAAMDEGVGNITKALKEKDIWENTLLIFTTDNGGLPGRGGNNHPLRGMKDTLWEGGVHGVGFVSGGLIKGGSINKQLVHVSDWYPTLLNLAGGNSSKVKGLDGYDQWKTITENKTSARREILHNIDPLARIGGKSASAVYDTRVRSALRYEEWKILTGNPGFNGWVPEPTGSVQSENQKNDYFWTQLWKRSVAAVCDWFARWLKPNKDSQSVYLFNIAQDPEERHELSAQYPDIVQMLLKKLADYNATAVPVRFPPGDPRCDPSEHGGFWGPWLD